MTTAVPQHNLAATHERVAASVPDRECIVFRDRRLTYSEVTDRTRRLANALRARGLSAPTVARADLAGHECSGDRVAIYAHNGNEYLETMLASFKARLAPVNVNYRFVAEELRYILDDSGAAAVVFHSAFAPTLAEVLGDLPSIRVLIQIADESGHGLLPGAEWYEDVIASASPALPDCAGDWSPDDPYLLYTGGTTGMPKGVLWRQADIHRTAMGGRHPLTREPWPTLDAIVEFASGPRQHVVCTAAPFMHGAGQWLAFMAMNQGSTVVIPHEVTRFVPADICRLVETERVTYLQLVGDAFGRPIVEELEAGDYDLSSLTDAPVGRCSTLPRDQGAVSRLRTTHPDHRRPRIVRGRRPGSTGHCSRRGRDHRYVPAISRVRRRRRRPEPGTRARRSRRRMAGQAR